MCTSVVTYFQGVVGDGRGEGGGEGGAKEAVKREGENGRVKAGAVPIVVKG